MKFDSDHWRDRRYIAIREELEHAGFVCVRADEIRTSGNVPDEICRLLQKAELVVIDSSGDSHSVSYELGYCHGINRPSDTILLLRNDARLPFNYQHYRHRIYRNLKHLRILVRDYLQVHEPLQNNQTGYTFTFKLKMGCTGYIRDGAFCIFNALRDNKFSGRCECYSADQHFGFPEHFFSIGIMLRRSGRTARKAVPDHDWWMKLQRSVLLHSRKHAPSIGLESDLSEINEKRAMLASLSPSGIAEFSQGQIIRLLGPSTDSLCRLYYEVEKTKALSPDRNTALAS